MPKLISMQIPATTLANLLTTTSDAKTELMPYAVVLNSTDKMRLRTMAEGREGYVRLLARIAVAHTDSIARNDDPAELISALNYNQQLEDIRQAFMAGLELISNIQLANSKDIMTISDRYTAALQAGRSTNSALDMAMHEIDDWNKRYGPHAKTTDTTTPTANSTDTPAAQQ